VLTLLQYPGDRPGKPRPGGVGGRVRRGVRGYNGWMTTRLARPRDRKIIAGVCAGLARRFGLSTGLIRFAFIVFGLVGAGEIAYIVLWILMPKEG